MEAPRRNYAPLPLQKLDPNSLGVERNEAPGKSSVEEPSPSSDPHPQPEITQAKAVIAMLMEETGLDKEVVVHA